MIKVHLDTDIGGDLDDLCALAMLLKWPDVEITGITTVSDDKGMRAGFANYALNLAKRNDIPVKAGVDVSGEFYRMKLEYQNEKYWPGEITPVQNSLDESLELLKKSIESGSIIVAIGPYTNLYLLDQKYPGILKKAKLFLMGGYVYPIRNGYPNWGNNFDYNIQVDVKSAKYILENSNPTLIPLTVTVETFLKRSFLEKLKESDDLSKLIAKQGELFAKDEQMEEKYGRTCSNLPNDLINFLHDPLAVAIALGWNDEVEIKELPLKYEIENSWLTEKIVPSEKPTKIVTKINGEKFSNFWLKKVTS